MPRRQTTKKTTSELTMLDGDTIAAVATPPGVGAIAIVRISGPAAGGIADAVFAARGDAERVPHVLRRGTVRDAEGHALDDALAAFFRAPHSYTGEDVAELHVHGGPGAVANVLSAVLRAGARLAQPGEFTRRAFVNGRIDLAQAEAVADIIGAQSARAARAAAARLEGELGHELRRWREQLTARLVEIEAHVDYPDEVAAPAAGAIQADLDAQLAAIEVALAGAGAARALNEGIECAIVGAPNAGKSSLLNALARAERAIVSELPGTTRDIVEDRVAVEGVVLRLRDTAGLRVTDDPVEREGVARAQRAMSSAQLLLVVVDASQRLSPDARAAVSASEGRARVVVANKLDLGDAGLAELQALLPAGEGGLVSGSVRTDATVDEVRREIARLGWGGALPDGAAAVAANARQIDALVRAREALVRANETLSARTPIDLVSVDLRAAIAAYGEITGDEVTEDVLAGIFSRFCVGK